MSLYEGVDIYLIFGDVEVVVIVFICGGEIFIIVINIIYEVFGIGFMSVVNFLKFLKCFKDFIFYMLLCFENIFGVCNYIFYFLFWLIVKFLMFLILYLKIVLCVNGMWMCVMLLLCCSEFGV